MWLAVIGDEVKSFAQPVGLGAGLEIAFIVPGAQSPKLLQIRDDSRQLGVRSYDLAVEPPG